MKLSHKILLTLLAVLIIIQFFRPARNTADQLISDDDISKAYTLPDSVHNILIKKCYDCHSNHTTYPWYFKIQPVGWWMAHHVDEGKSKLNFSLFKTYNPKRAKHKLEEISESVTDGWMPLNSYLWIHHDAKVSPEETRAINTWIKSLGIEPEAGHDKNLEDHH